MNESTSPSDDYLLYFDPWPYPREMDDESYHDYASYNPIWEMDQEEARSQYERDMRAVTEQLGHDLAAKPPAPQEDAEGGQHNE